MQFKFEAIGTSWQIDISHDVSVKTENELYEAILKRIDEFDIAYSRFRKDSLVSKMSESIGEYELPEDAKAMLMLYHALYKRTGGMFTPLVGNILSDAGYDSDYSLTERNEPRPALLWDEVIDYSHPKVNIKQKIILDFGAAGKGYLVDIISELIRSYGFQEFIVDAGGDMCHSGKEKIRVGLENPKNSEEAIGVAVIGNESICGSATNRRVWGRWNHVINPKTAKPADDILAVWTIASSTLLADALSTCLFFVSPDTLTDVYDFEYVIVKNDMSVSYSKGFSGDLFVRA